MVGSACPWLLAPQGPWLLLPRDTRHGVANDDSRLSFYDLAKRKTHRFDLPFVGGKYVCGTSYGWLVREHNHRVSLLNPMTRSTIAFPAFRTLYLASEVAARKRKWSSGPSDENETYEVCILKAILSRNPSEPGCCVVARFLWMDHELAFCRIGDDHWTNLRGRNVEVRTIRMLDFTCHNDLIYTINEMKKRVTTYDLQDLSVRTFASKLTYNRSRDRVYLVEGDGEFGGPFVVRHCNNSGKIKVTVHKRLNDPQPGWHQVRDIGNRVLFLSLFDQRSTFSSAILKVDKWRGNQVCYDVNHRQSTECSDAFHIGIDRVNVENGKNVQKVARSIGVVPATSGSNAWFTPSLL